jgi:hypothetical protein
MALDYSADDVYKIDGFGWVVDYWEDLFL